MKKLFTFMLSSLFVFTLFGCSNSKYYINEKISADGTLKEAKELADKINDVESVQSELNINTSDGLTALTNDTVSNLDESSDEIDITNKIFRVTEAKLYDNTFKEVEHALEEAKHMEFLCFENHIAYLNEWEYWGDGNGQVRILYDKKEDSFTWEKLANDCVWDEATQSATFFHDGRKEYRKYTTKLRKNGKLEISNIEVHFNENTHKIAEQNEFLYVEGEYFEENRYKYFDDISNYTDFNFQTITDDEKKNYTCQDYFTIHIGLSSDNKYYEDCRIAKISNKENNTSFNKYFYNYQKYFNSFIYSYNEHNNDGFVRSQARLFDYSLIELLNINYMNDSESLYIDMDALGGYSRITFNNRNRMANIYNTNNEKIIFGNYLFLSCFESDNNKYTTNLYLDLNNKKDGLDELFGGLGLTLKNNISLSNSYNIFKDKRTNNNDNNLNGKINSFKFYDEKYISNSIKKSNLTPVRTGNDVECEITGNVKLENGKLDLTDVKIVIDKGNVYTDGKEYNYGGLLWIDGSTNLEFVKTPNYKCENGKIVIDNLGVYDVNRFSQKLTQLSRVCIMFMTYDPRAAIKISLCDIVLETTDGNINGTPVPIDYTITDFTKK